VHEVSFGVPAGVVKAIIGPNGAGKTTLFNLITGFLTPDQGRIVFRGEDIQGQPAHVVAAKGIARTFQIVQLFDHMTVLENVMVGRHRLTRAGLLAGHAALSWNAAGRGGHPGPRPGKPWNSWVWPTGPTSPRRSCPWV
jgi:branched-chain amino acid transport system ATP-binding protein